MRLALLSDIHGNLEALQAVLHDVARRQVEGMIHLGDLVGYGPDGDAVAALVQEQEMMGVVGNYDLAVCHEDAAEGRSRYLNPVLSAVGERTYHWTRANLRDEARSYLRTLPAQLKIEEGSSRFLFTHGSPERPNEYLHGEVPVARLEELFDGCAADVMVVGHTHAPQARAVGDRLLLNPGSVGKPKDGDPRASYLILDTEDGLRVEHVRVEFDVETTVTKSVDSGVPREQAEALFRGESV